MAHEYSFLAGFLQEVDTGVSTAWSSQGRTFKHKSGGSGSMPRPRLLRLTSCTLVLAPSPYAFLSFRFSTLFAVFNLALTPPSPENSPRDSIDAHEPAEKFSKERSGTR